MRAFLSTLFMLALAEGVLSHQTAVALEGRLQLEGGELVLDLGDGRVLRRENLIGLRLAVTNGKRDVLVRIDGIEEDVSTPDEPLALYRLSIVDPDRPSSKEVCQPDAKGRRLAFLYPDEAGRFALTCTSGAEGKCALLGYRPWQPRDGIPMRDLHRACIHLIRADYGGDDRPTTRDGTLVNVYDRFGIQTRAPAAGMTFEAAWGPDGALCVAHPRIAGTITLNELATRYPHLVGRVGPTDCQAEAAHSDMRAILFNESGVTGSIPE